MAFVSVTRLRLRSWRYLIPFLWYSHLSKESAADWRAIDVRVRRARGAFWTLSIWRERDHRRAFMMSGAHRKAMPHLQDWCDEASVADWEQDASTLPSWAEAEDRLARQGRLSTVKHPSTAHAAGHTLGSSGSNKGGTSA